MKKQLDFEKIHKALTAVYEKPTAANIKKVYAPNALVRVAHPINDQKGHDAIAKGFLKPISNALQNLERREDIFFTNAIANTPSTICAMGHLCGNFDKPLFGIPPTGGAGWLRYGEFHALNSEGLITKSYVLLDFIFLMRQTGIHILPESHGEEILVPGPRTHDGVKYEKGPAKEAKANLDSMEGMMHGLNSYQGDPNNLKVMQQHKFWHPQFMWYGPGGIGTSRSLKGFEDFHQRPFLLALPDRRGGTHYMRMANENYISSGGWPSMAATHTGGSWLGLPASDKKITLRVMDFWRREDKLLRENWVLIDHLDILKQIGRDVMAELPLRSRRRS